VKKKKVLLLLTTGLRPPQGLQIFKRSFCKKAFPHWSARP